MSQPPQDRPDFLPPGAQQQPPQPTPGPNWRAPQGPPGPPPPGQAPTGPTPPGPEWSARQLPPSTQAATRPAPVAPRRSVLTWVVVLAVLIPVLGIAWHFASRSGPVDTDPMPSAPGTPSPTFTPSQYSGINPGYEPSNGSGPFSEPRESRPPVQPPTATPKQEWPDLEGPVAPVAAWTTVDGGPERGSYRIPSTGWTYKDGMMMGYETMHRVVAGNIVSFDREDQCQDDYWSAVMLRKGAPDQPDLERFTRLLVMDFAQMRNTEYEGDYYEIPAAKVEPFTFADGGEGFIGSVSFVPMYKNKYSCNTPAIRISAVTRSHEGLAYQMLAITHIGDAQSLPLATEREILATFTVGE